MFGNEYELFLGSCVRSSGTQHMFADNHYRIISIIKRSHVSQASLRIIFVVNDDLELLMFPPLPPES